MSGLYYLTSDDFHLQNGSKGPIMCNKFRGLTLVLFYSTGCVHCQSLIPIFKNLPGTVPGASFGLVNVGQNKSCVMLSQETIAPIKYVPYIMLYVHGRPYILYKEEYSQEKITDFIIKVARSIQSKQQFSKDVSVHQKTHNSIPEYTLGHPIVGDGKICYLQFNNESEVGYLKCENPSDSYQHQNV